MIYCYGIVPLHEDRRGWAVLLVLHRKGHWGLPKGHPNEGETPKETAERELFEETKLKVETFLEAPPFVEHYKVNDVPKEVTYFLAKVAGQVTPQRGEISAAKWVSLEEAAMHATFSEHQALLKKIVHYLHERE